MKNNSTYKSGWIFALILVLSTSCASGVFAGVKNGKLHKLFPQNPSHSVLSWAGLIISAHEPAVVAAATVKITQYQVKPEFQDTFRKVMGEYVTNALEVKGNIMAEAYFERENASTLWLIERWEGNSPYESFQSGNQKKALDLICELALITPAKKSDFVDIEPLTKSQWRKQPNPADQPFTAMLFVDGKVNTENTFITRYHKAMPAFRSEKGIVTYGLSQSTSDATKFVTYEKFRSDQAFQFHLKFPPIEPVVDYLKTSIKNPPFEKSLHNLIQFAPSIN